MSGMTDEAEARLALVTEMNETAALRAQLAAMQAERDAALASLAEVEDHARQIEDRARKIEDENDFLWVWHRKLKETRAGVVNALNVVGKTNKAALTREALKLSEDPDEPDFVVKRDIDNYDGLEITPEVETWLEFQLRRRRRDVAGNVLLDDDGGQTRPRAIVYSPNPLYQC